VEFGGHNLETTGQAKDGGIKASRYDTECTGQGQRG
jgi:hypothetical protein